LTPPLDGLAWPSYIRSVKITVALTPGLLRDAPTSAIVVVDVLRATSSLVAMFESGLLRAMVSESLREARALSRRHFSLLCGEVKSLPAPGFDHGNSPAEYAAMRLKGKSAVLFTTNGTRAMAAASAAPFAAAGALLNRTAVARRALEEAARRDIDVAVMCAGSGRGTAFSLEDTAAAGAIVEAARALDPAVAMTDESWAAYHLWRWYDGDATRVFRESKHGRALAELGFDDDLRLAAKVDLYDAVPLLSCEGGLNVLRLAPKKRRQREA
jgi:2-phosphosulfolactate phosphatase